MRRPALPAFIADVVEPGARGALVTGSAALFAAGLNPQVWSASLPSVQAAIRARPELEAVTLVAAVIGAGFVLVGGALGDTTRARPIVLGGLTVELLASALGLLVPEGAFFVASRAIGAAVAAFVLPVSLAIVATSYAGVARATAIGIAYAAFGAAGALGLVLLQLLPGSVWPAFAGAILACGFALWIARRRVPDLMQPTAVERPTVYATALWGLGIVAVTTGVVWFGSGWDNPVRWALIGTGCIALVVATIHDRRRRRSSRGVQMDRRPVAVAVFVGLILALAQTVPILQLPLYFKLVLHYGPLLATLAVVPLFAALILAGPIAGILLARFTPRTLVGAGVVVVGLGDLGLALVVTPGAGYLEFVFPSILVGAGFVIATTVRTAIIFASVPRGLPATAAALNEASIAVGTRIGSVLVTAVVAQTALAFYAASLGGTPDTRVDGLVASFAEVLTAVGTSSFAQVATDIDPREFGPYLEAYATGVRVALVGGAAVAICGGVVAWLALERRAPLSTVYEHQDERAGTPN